MMLHGPLNLFSQGKKGQEDLQRSNVETSFWNGPPMMGHCAAKWLWPKAGTRDRKKGMRRRQGV